MVLIALGHSFNMVCFAWLAVRHFSFVFAIVILNNYFKIYQFNLSMHFHYGIFENMQFIVSTTMIFSMFY